MLRTVHATRYVLPLREGGSLPAIVEADDSGMYVVKFRGAGQGALALVAELVAGELARALGLAVPELVFIEVDAVLGRSEPDAEIRHLLKASSGLNLALDYLPGSLMFDPAAGNTAPSAVASMAVWFDAFVQNVDRTPRNPNLLLWHSKLFFIDHGAALFFHHNWPTAAAKATSPFAESAHHVLLPWAADIQHAGIEARARLTPELIADVLALIPDAWLAPEDPRENPAENPTEDTSAEARRAAYLAYLLARLDASAIFEQEALHAYQRLV